MPQVTITIKTDSAAFDENPETEIALVLAQAAKRFENGTAHDGTKLLDINGNTCGNIQIKE